MDKESLADGEVVKFEGKNWAGGPTVCLDWLTERQIHTHRECVCVCVWVRERESVCASIIQEEKDEWRKTEIVKKICRDRFEFCACVS